MGFASVLLFYMPLLVFLQAAASFFSCGSLSKLLSPVIILVIRTRGGFLNNVLHVAQEEGCSAASPGLSL